MIEVILDKASEAIFKVVEGVFFVTVISLCLGILCGMLAIPFAAIKYLIGG